MIPFALTTSSTLSWHIPRHWWWLQIYYPGPIFSESQAHICSMCAISKQPTTARHRSWGSKFKPWASRRNPPTYSASFLVRSIQVEYLQESWQILRKLSTHTNYTLRWLINLQQKCNWTYSCAKKMFCTNHAPRKAQWLSFVYMVINHKYYITLDWDWQIDEVDNAYYKQCYDSSWFRYNPRSPI